MRVHPDLERARLNASAFRVLHSKRGFHVWRFTDWSEEDGGWRIVVEVREREDGWLHILSRLGLMKEAPPDPLAPAPRRAPSADYEWP